MIQLKKKTRSIACLLQWPAGVPFNSGKDLKLIASGRNEAPKGVGSQQVIKRRVKRRATLTYARPTLGTPVKAPKENTRPDRAGSPRGQFEELRKAKERLFTLQRENEYLRRMALAEPAATGRGLRIELAMQQFKQLVFQHFLE